MRFNVGTEKKDNIQVRGESGKTLAFEKVLARSVRCFWGVLGLEVRCLGGGG